jgi:hypothetical protein
MTVTGQVVLARELHQIDTRVLSEVLERVTKLCQQVGGEHDGDRA